MQKSATTFVTYRLALELLPYCGGIKIILAFYAKLDICALSDRVSHPMHKHCTELFMHDQFEGMQNEKNHLAVC